MFVPSLRTATLTRQVGRLTFGGGKGERRGKGRTFQDRAKLSVRLCFDTCQQY